jgi:peptide/nickel transport system substrate-binding protein
VAHSIMDPGQPQYRNVEARLPHYDYDPRRAASIFQELGYTRGADGMLRDGAGQKLAIEIRCAPTDINLKSMTAVADYWQQAGVDVTQVPIPPAQQGNLPYRATYPGFELLRNPNDLRLLPLLHSSQIKTAENNWSGSYTGYHDPEYDTLLERYLVTIPQADRLSVIEQLMYHIADQAVVLGLFYDTLPVAISRRLQGAVGTRVEGNGRVWGVYEWDLAS